MRVELKDELKLNFEERRERTITYTRERIYNASACGRINADGLESLWKIDFEIRNRQELDAMRPYYEYRRKINDWRDSGNASNSFLSEIWGKKKLPFMA